MIVFSATFDVAPALAAEGTQEERLDTVARATFYAKSLDYQGIPIKAPAVVADEALEEARRRLDLMLHNMPVAVANLRVEGAELHIIGKNQATSDLPEHRHLKGKPYEGKMTIDERTRGVGGLSAPRAEKKTYCS